MAPPSIRPIPPALFGLLLLAGPAAPAQFLYTTNNGSLIITGYTGPVGAVTIPARLNNLPVAGIGPGAFSGSSLTGVTIENGVTLLGEAAFSSCPNLTSVTIPASVVSLGADAFYNCFSLDSITLAEGVATIGDGTFAGCSILPGITLPASVTSLGNDAFNGCLSLATLYFQGNAPAYGSDVFLSDDNATVYYLPGATGWSSPFAGLPAVPWTPLSYTTNAGALAVTGYTGPGGSVTIPGAVNGLPVTGIGAAAFFDAGVTSVTIPAGVTNLGDGAFESCPNLTGVFFQGNAPDPGSNVFLLDDNATVYYAPGAIGWSSFFGGVPAVPWNPQILTGDAGFGARSNQFGFNIMGASNLPVAVEAAADLADPVWLQLLTINLTNGFFHFSEPLPANRPGRFYRLSPP